MDTWACMFLVVATGAGFQWALVGQIQECCPIMHRASVTEELASL